LLGAWYVSQALATTNPGVVVLLVTLLGIATGNLAQDKGALPWGLDFFRQGSLPLAIVIVALIIGLMIWQHATEERQAMRTRPVWNSNRSPSLDWMQSLNRIQQYSLDATPRSLNCWIVFIPWLRRRPIDWWR
jgi:hypothetical protein